jgi:hypothetical protein
MVKRTVAIARRHCRPLGGSMASGRGEDEGALRVLEVALQNGPKPSAKSMYVPQECSWFSPVPINVSAAFPGVREPESLISDSLVVCTSRLEDVESAKGGRVVSGGAIALAVPKHRG